jgi:hypothetical protein
MKTRIGCGPARQIESISDMNGMSARAQRKTNARPQRISGHARLLGRDAMTREHAQVWLSAFFADEIEAERTWSRRPLQWQSSSGATLRHFARQSPSEVGDPESLD